MRGLTRKTDIERETEVRREGNDDNHRRAKEGKSEEGTVRAGPNNRNDGRTATGRETKDRNCV